MAASFLMVIRHGCPEVEKPSWRIFAALAVLFIGHQLCANPSFLEGKVTNQALTPKIPTTNAKT